MIFFITNRNKQTYSYPVLSVILVFIEFLFINTAIAKPIQIFEPAERIQKTAKDFLEKMTLAADNPSIELTVNNIDSRLKLKTCDSDLIPNFSPSSKKRGKVILIIKCAGPVAWKVFVTATIYEFSNVVVATKTLSRKSIINAQDTAIKRVNISLLRKKPLTQLSQVIGSTPKRFIRAGDIIFDSSICMVCRGDNVQVLAKSQFFKINLKGIALADASIGDMTQVRNIQSKRTFSAKVIGKNQLEVSL